MIHEPIPITAAATPGSGEAEHDEQAAAAALFAVRHARAPSRGPPPAAAASSGGEPPVAKSTSPPPAADAPSEAPEGVTLTEMVRALKRKLIDVEGQRQDVARRAEQLESQLAMEKREVCARTGPWPTRPHTPRANVRRVAPPPQHQRTTVKLSRLLAKRSASDAAPAHEAELQSLRRAVANLRQQLEQRDSLGERPPAKRPSDTDQHAAPAAPAAPESEASPPPQQEPTPMSVESQGAGSASMGKRSLSADLPENAAPRLQNVSAAGGAADVSPAADGAAGAGGVGGAGGAGSGGGGAGGAAPPPSAVPMVRSVSMSMRTPHGYVEGAICIEAPRRQRVRTSTVRDNCPTPPPPCSALLRPAPPCSSLLRAPPASVAPRLRCAALRRPTSSRRACPAPRR